jgi:hypothetical protein
MPKHTNPFPADPCRSAIWEMLVERDIAAYIGQDWAMVAGDFIEEGFTGIHAHKSPNPDKWTLAFPTLTAYREEWLRQAAESAATKFAEPRRGWNRSKSTQTPPSRTKSSTEKSRWPTGHSTC